MTANVRHSSENREFMTPAWLVEVARYVLGGIDCDPATSVFANEVVRAPVIYTAETNGLLAPRWEGRTLLNPPGGLIDREGRAVYHARKVDGVRVEGCTVTGECGLPPGHKHRGIESSAALFWRVLCKQWELEHVPAAFFVGFSLELLQSCQGGPQPPHFPLDFNSCIPKDRIKFDLVENGQRVPGKDPTHSNLLALMPPTNMRTGTKDVLAIARFEEALASVGWIGRGNGQYS